MADPDVTLCPVCGVDVNDCECTAEALADHRKRLEEGQGELVDASNPAQTARMARGKKRVEQEAKDDMAWLMRHPQGRRIMWQLLERCSIFQNAYTRGEGRSEAVMFHLGESNVGLVYWREIMVREPDGYNLMVKENSGRLTT